MKRSRVLEIAGRKRFYYWEPIDKEEYLGGVNGIPLNQSKVTWGTLVEKMLLKSIFAYLKRRLLTKSEINKLVVLVAVDLKTAWKLKKEQTKRVHSTRKKTQKHAPL